MALGLTTTGALTGCIEETFPSSYATADQVGKDPMALSTIVNSLSNYLIDYKTYGGSTDYTDAGIPGMMIARDAMCEDIPVSDASMDWYRFHPLGTCTGWGANPYYYFYTFADKINDVLKSVDIDALEGESAHMVGNLLGYRAMVYFDLARMYEFQPTSFAGLDDEAKNNGILGKTVPIIEARDYTVEELVRNPRAPFYTMYRFIMEDLNNAERLLKDYERPKVSLLDQSVIYGFKARLWLEMASRFDRSSEDLATQLAAEGSDDGYDDLEINTALDCYNKAIEYADKVIASGYSPLTSKEWHDPVNGFNKPTSSWIWGSYITTYAESPGRWYSFCTWMCSDADWGWPAGYGAYRCISKKLFDSMPDEDWRKTSWISPEDAGNASALNKYSTNNTAKFASLPAYANLKFHVPDITEYSNGLVTCVPFMRVEEMYLLKAEALYHTSGIGSAVSELEKFVNIYRYTEDTYQCEATDYNSFIEELMIQRRIELWGEGLVFFDYKRLHLGINRAYPGTNYLELYRLVTPSGYVAPWMNCYISEYAVSMKDSNFKGNPNFSGVVTASN